MVATNNGRYTSIYSGDCSEYSIQIPTDAPVNITDEWKMLGETNTVSTIPEIVVSGTSETVSCQSGITPHFKAMFVDRRFDYDLAVLGPITSSMIPSGLDFGSDTSKNKATCIRMAGTIYNGIEMAYDDDYNIISAHFESGYTDVPVSIDGATVWDREPTPSKDEVSADTTLEYTYYYDKGNTNNVGIIYNSGGTYWKDYGDDINTTIKQVLQPHAIEAMYYKEGDTNKPILKTFYSAILRNHDIRQLFWSNENKDRLQAVFSIGSINTWENNGLPFYLFNHHNHTSLFNGEFGVSNSYPTKRFIDIGKIVPAKNLKFLLTPCGYDLGLELNDETHLLNSVINEGASLDIQFNFGCLTPSPKGEDEDYGHITYEANISTSTSDEDFSTLSISATNIYIGMNYNTTDYGDFNAYSRHLKVLTLNELQELKMEIVSDYTDGSSVGQIIRKWKGFNKKILDRTTVNNELRVREKNGYGWVTAYTANAYWEEYPYKTKDGFICYGDEPLDYDDNEIYNCRIGKSIYAYIKQPNDKGPVTFQYHISHQGSGSTIQLPDDDFFVVSAMRHLFPVMNENLTKKITLFDFSDVYDKRKINIRYNCQNIYNNEIDSLKFKVIIKDDSDNKAIAFKNIENVEVTFAIQNVSEDGANRHEWSKYVLKDKFKYSHSISESGTVIESEDFIECPKFEGIPMYVRVIFIYITLKNGLIYKLLLQLPTIYNSEPYHDNMYDFYDRLQKIYEW
jgi:hypothetical protein